jgi:hypothetical protein
MNIVLLIISDKGPNIIGQFFLFIQVIQVWADKFFTLDTDDVWMGVRLVSIISVTPIREP